MSLIVIISGTKIIKCDTSCGGKKRTFTYYFFFLAWSNQVKKKEKRKKICHNLNFSATLLGRNAPPGQKLLVRDTKNIPRDKLTPSTHNLTMTNSVATRSVP